MKWVSFIIRIKPAASLLFGENAIFASAKKQKCCTRRTISDGFPPSPIQTERKSSLSQPGRSVKEYHDVCGVRNIFQGKARVSVLKSSLIDSLCWGHVGSAGAGYVISTRPVSGLNTGQSSSQVTGTAKVSRPRRCHRFLQDRAANMTAHHSPLGSWIRSAWPVLSIWAILPRLRCVMSGLRGLASQGPSRERLRKMVSA